MEHVSKICADSLRACAIDNYNVKLKSTHAHELVAAAFGYKSNAALLADKSAHINNLPQAEIILMPFENLIDQRRKELQGLPFELPDSHTLAEVICAPLFSDKWWKSSYSPFRSFEELAKSITENNVSYQHAFRFYKNTPMHHIWGFTESDIIKILHCHEILTGELVVDGETTIKLPRVAGYIGYGKLEVSPVKILTGGARKTIKKIRK